MKEQTFPFKELADYPLDIWLNDLMNLIKKRSFFNIKKEDAFLIFCDNAAEFMEMYCNGDSPREAIEEFNNDE